MSEDIFEDKDEVRFFGGIEYVTREYAEFVVDELTMRSYENGFEDGYSEGYHKGVDVGYGEAETERIRYGG